MLAAPRSAALKARVLRVAVPRRAAVSARAVRAVAEASPDCSMQLIQGVNETIVPDVRLTASRDGNSGTAFFSFDGPDVFDAAGDLGEITGLYMLDEEGEIKTIDVNAKFVNGKPSRIECKYTWRSSFERERFLRFMARYADANGMTASGAVADNPS